MSPKTCPFSNQTPGTPSPSTCPHQHRLALAARAKQSVLDVFTSFFTVVDHRNFKGWDAKLMKELEQGLVEVGEEGRTVFHWTVGEEYGNVNEAMHGGAVGTVFDMCMTTAVAPLAKPGFWEFLGGVSRTINISFTKAIPVGATIRISSHIVQLGKQMQMIRSEMTDLEGKVVYATCEQHKVQLKPFLRDGEELVDGKVVLREKAKL